MHFIDEQDSWNKFSNTLIDVLIDNLIDLLSELISDFGFLWLHDLAHEGHEILSMLRSSICNIQIMKSDILNDFFLLVNVSLR